MGSLPWERGRGGHTPVRLGGELRAWLSRECYRCGAGLQGKSSSVAYRVYAENTPSLRLEHVELTLRRSPVGEQRIEQIRVPCRARAVIVNDRERVLRIRANQQPA